MHKVSVSDSVSILVPGHVLSSVFNLQDVVVRLVRSSASPWVSLWEL